MVETRSLDILMIRQMFLLVSVAVVVKVKITFFALSVSFISIILIGRPIKFLLGFDLTHKVGLLSITSHDVCRGCVQSLSAECFSCCHNFGNFENNCYLVQFCLLQPK